jgi:hypothetical protein
MGTDGAAGRESIKSLRASSFSEAKVRCLITGSIFKGSLILSLKHSIASIFSEENDRVPNICPRCSADTMYRVETCRIRSTFSEEKEQLLNCVIKPEKLAASNSVIIFCCKSRLAIRNQEIGTCDCNDARHTRTRGTLYPDSFRDHLAKSTRASRGGEKKDPSRLLSLHPRRFTTSLMTSSGSTRAGTPPGDQSDTSRPLTGPPTPPPTPRNSDQEFLLCES